LSNSQLEAAVEFAENPEPRCPCILLVDTSGSMEGERINALNAGLRTFKDDLTKDSLASRRVEIAIVTFNSEVVVLQNFVTVEKFQPPVLRTSGQTFMGSGIESALGLAEARKQIYRENGIAYYRPWIFMITDGKPEGEPEEIVQQAARQLRDRESQKSIAFFAVGVAGADMNQLAQLVVRQPVKLKGLDFGAMFVWLSASMQSVSHSDADDVMVGLPPVGWGHVSQ
jgi:uncharacterized protein YegL